MHLLTPGYVFLAGIGMWASLAPGWYKAVFLAGGTGGLAALWWLLTTTILLLQKKRRHAVPLVIKVSTGTGFLFAIWIVLYPWLARDQGRVANPLPVDVLCFVTIPGGIAIHLICLLRERHTTPRGPVVHFLDD